MARPLFIIGMQRNGTSFLARIVQAAPGVSRQFHPCARWDIPLLAELGADLPSKQSPWCQGMGIWFGHRPEQWALAKLALPCGAESFAWPLLGKHFSRAAFVFILRGAFEAQASWRDGLPYLAAYGAQTRVSPAAFLEWSAAQKDLIEQFAAARPGQCMIVQYEELVLAPKPTMAPVWKLLDTKAPKGFEKWIRKPKHWNLPRRKASAQARPRAASTVGGESRSSVPARV